MIKIQLEIEATTKFLDQSRLSRLSHFSTVNMSEAQFILGGGLEAAHIVTCAGT